MADTNTTTGMIRHAQRMNRDAALDASLRRIAGIKLGNMLRRDADELRAQVDDRCTFSPLMTAADVVVTDWVAR